MKNADQPIHPCLVQQVGSSAWRPAKPGDPKEHSRMLPGMTKREYFAVMAMQGLLAFSHEDNAPTTANVKNAAEVAVFAADALLLALDATVKK